MDKKSSTKLIEWAKKTLNFEDIHIDLVISNESPDWVSDEYVDSPGVCMINSALKNARIWVSPILCKDQDFSIELVILHEIVEAWFGEAGFVNNSERKHFIIDRTAIILEALWLLQRRKK